MQEGLIDLKISKITKEKSILFDPLLVILIILHAILNVLKIFLLLTHMLGDFFMSLKINFQDWILS